ncbi:hypothetical protein IMSAGC018_01678 [Lachnospiraceae bacterium]|nr:hypothetical protein IMSAGC018_01678 [Lachnospiraceae bacterium]
MRLSGAKLIMKIFLQKMSGKGILGLTVLLLDSL